MLKRMQGTSTGMGRELGSEIGVPQGYLLNAHHSVKDLVLGKYTPGFSATDCGSALLVAVLLLVLE